MYEDLIKQFMQDIDNLRGFSRNLSGYLIQKDKEEREISKLHFEYSTLVNEFVLKDFPSKDEETVFIEELCKINEQVKSIYGKDARFSYSVFKKSSLIRSFGQSAVVLRVNDKQRIIKHSEEESQRMVDHCNTIYKSTFINLVITLEFYVTNLLHELYRLDSESVNIDDESIKYSVLIKMGSIDAAKKHLVDCKIEKQLEGGVVTWINKLDQELKLELNYVKPLRNKIIEVFQRRNLVVHNRGIVDAKYLHKVDKSLRTGVKIGDVLSIDEEYLDDSIDLLSETFISIASELWTKDLDKDAGRSTKIAELVDSYINCYRYEIAITLCSLIEKDENASEYARKFALLNRLWCVKEQSDYQSIQAELKNLDITDDDPTLQIFLFALRHDYDGLVKRIKNGIDEREFEIHDIINVYYLDEFISSSQLDDLLDTIYLDDTPI